MDLFTQCDLQQRMSMSYDGMTCWLRSLEEAHKILSFQEQHLRQTTHQTRSLFRQTQDIHTISSTSTDIT